MLVATITRQAQPSAINPARTERNRGPKMSLTVLPAYRQLMHTRPGKAVKPIHKIGALATCRLAQQSHCTAPGSLDTSLCHAAALCEAAWSQA